MMNTLKIFSLFFCMIICQHVLGNSGSDRHLQPANFIFSTQVSSNPEKQLSDEAFSNYEALLLKAESINKMQQILIIILCIFSVMTGLVAFYFVKREKKHSITRIRLLNKRVGLQIESAKKQAICDTQVQLSQELHDGLSGSLLGYLNRIQSLSIRAESPEFKENLSALYHDFRTTCDSVRDISHELYALTEKNTLEQLDNSIKKIIDNALPGEEIRKEIDIDKEAVSLLDAKYRFETLRIIQEAITNVMKHAKDVTEVFVFLFRTDDGITLEIGDNGKLIRNHSVQTTGMGLSSIKKRIKDLNGHLETDTSSGMVLKIFFPA